MRVLVACECSGVVRDAFLARGHDAVSCDLLPCMAPGPHIQGDILDVLKDGWDLMIAHPPCTFLCRSGLHHNIGNPLRQWLTEQALDFVRSVLGAPIPRICLENPPGRIGTAIRPADQYVQPYQFGHDAGKLTGLWLKNLPKLVPTAFRPGRIERHPESGVFYERWGNQTVSGRCKVGQKKDRWLRRSVTYAGLATAMAEQWG